MKMDVAEGIHAYAHAEVEALDGMIQMLETIVAMQNLSDVAGEKGDKNTIEINDLLPEIEFDDDGIATNLDKITTYGKKYGDLVDQWRD